MTHRVIAARYLWNIALCEVLYAPLQMCEVGLRNAIDQAMLKITNQSNWFDTITLTSWGYVQVGKAKQKIAGSGKDVTSGRVIAELSFGFWTSMFEDHYEKHPGARFLPAGIKLTFPNLPKSEHN